MSREAVAKWKKGVRLHNEQSQSVTMTDGSVLSDVSEDENEKQINDYISKVRRKTGASHLWGTSSSLERPDELLERFTGQRMKDLADSDSDEDLRKFIEGLTDSENDPASNKSDNEPSEDSYNPLRNLNVLPGGLSDHEGLPSAKETKEDISEGSDHSSVRFNYALELDDEIPESPRSLRNAAASLRSDSDGPRVHLQSIGELDDGVKSISEPVDTNIILSGRNIRSRLSDAFVEEEIVTESGIISEVKTVETQQDKSYSSRFPEHKSSSRSSKSSKNSSSSQSNTLSDTSSISSSTSSSATCVEKPKSDRKKEKKSHSSSSSKRKSENSRHFRKEKKVPAIGRKKESDLPIHNDFGNPFLPQREMRSDRLHYPQSTPLLRHVGGLNELDLVTNYSPAILSLNDVMKFHLHLTNQYIEDSRRLYESYSNVITKTHKYTTVKDTVKEIKKRKSKLKKDGGK